MTRAPRLVLALAALAGAAGARAAEVDPLLPKEAEQVVYVNFKQILESDLVKKYAVPKAKEALKKGEAEAIFETLGLDPLKDVDTVTVGIWGDGPADTNIVAIVRGKFNPEKLGKAAEDFTTKYPDRVAVVTEEDLKLIKVGDKNRPFFIYVVDETTVFAATTPKLVAVALESKKTKAKANLKPKLTALVLRQDAKASMFFCQLTENVFNKDKLEKAPNLDAVPGIDGGILKEQLATVTSISATLRVGKDFQLELTAGLKDADAAEAFGGTVDKLLGLLKTFLPVIALRMPDKQPFFDDFGKTVKHTVKKSDVIISMRLTPEGFGSLFGGGADE